MKTYFLLHKYCENHSMIWRLSNRLEWVDSRWRDSYQHDLSWNLCNSKLQSFCAQLFNFKIIFSVSIFENVVADRVLTLPCILLSLVPYGRILHPPKWEAHHAVILWNYGSDGSKWFFPSAVTNITPRSSASNTSTTLQIPKVVFSWLECTMVSWIFESFQLALWILKGYTTPTKNFTDTTVFIGNDTWEVCSVTRFLGRHIPRRLVSNGVGRFPR